MWMSLIPECWDYRPWPYTKHLNFFLLNSEFLILHITNINHITHGLQTIFFINYRLPLYCSVPWTVKGTFNFNIIHLFGLIFVAWTFGDFLKIITAKATAKVTAREHTSWLCFTQLHDLSLSILSLFSADLSLWWKKGSRSFSCEHSAFLSMFIIKRRSFPFWVFLVPILLWKLVNHILLSLYLHSKSYSVSLSGWFYATISLS